MGAVLLDARIKTAGHKTAGIVKRDKRTEDKVLE